MSSVFLFHGFGGSPDNNWFPWLTHELEAAGPREDGDEVGEQGVRLVPLRDTSRPLEPVTLIELTALDPAAAVAAVAASLKLGVTAPVTANVPNCCQEPAW